MYRFVSLYRHYIHLIYVETNNIVLLFMPSIKFYEWRIEWMQIKIRWFFTLQFGYYVYNNDSIG